MIGTSYMIARICREMCRHISADEPGSPTNQKFYLHLLLAFYLIPDNKESMLSVDFHDLL